MGDLTLPWKPSWETIAIYGDGWTGVRTDGVLRGTVITYSAGSWNGAGGRAHPHEKPIGVLRELIAKAPPELPIVDPFAGSGTTGVACVMLGRDFYGSEINSEYHAVASERLAIKTRVGTQQTLF